MIYSENRCPLFPGSLPPRPKARTHRLRPLADFDLGGGDHRLGAALDAELLQDRRDMRLDGRLGDDSS